MILLATAFVLARAGIQISQRDRPKLQDYFIYIAFVLFLAMAICDLIGIPQVSYIIKSDADAPHTFDEQKPRILFGVRLAFVTTLLFWASLLCVKLSLLALYKRLVAGQSRVYIRAWWAVLVFCLVGCIACMAGHLGGCSDFLSTIKQGTSCANTRSDRGPEAILYASYAWNVLTDLMIMILPIRLTWNLRLGLRQKIGLYALFASGSICIAIATLRVVQIGSHESGHVKPVSTSLWTAVEASVAVCIGCTPAFVAYYRKIQAQGSSDGAHHLDWRGESQSLENSNGADAIKMDVMNVKS
ncbi:hypothetical protein T440DRAFT_422147 [Plenodomus tracheiphilus IPT5]|uniref:Rhodopsin domain-containing protein n=1 Tax=Plenodomus tracheiphilus IPT5 TaxID=1408161 RepID=A0A6A7B7W4_9PLEO|nr:hypothetical protein T440DRAFT_422147 [Plenodomus tracheiphilus IPT5]